MLQSTKYCQAHVQVHSGTVNSYWNTYVIFTVTTHETFLRLFKIKTSLTVTVSNPLLFNFYLRMVSWWHSKLKRLVTNQVRVLPHPHLLRSPGGWQGQKASQRVGRLRVRRLHKRELRRQRQAHWGREEEDPGGSREGRGKAYVFCLRVFCWIWIIMYFCIHDWRQGCEKYLGAIISKVC